MTEQGMEAALDATIARAEQVEGEVVDACLLIEGALTGAEPRREIWDNADYLCAVLAMLSHDGDRARDALLTHRAKYTPDRGSY